MIQTLSPQNFQFQVKANISFLDASPSPTTNISFMSQNSQIESIPEENLKNYQINENLENEESFQKNQMLLNFYENEEDTMMNYKFMEHYHLLPFQVNYSNDSLILIHEKEFGLAKNKSMMGLLSLKQENFIENFINSRNMRKIMKENQYIEENMDFALDKINSEKNSIKIVKKMPKNTMIILKKRINKLRKKTHICFK